MSEYQYYEFAAIDRPLTRTEMAELRALSTRAVITPSGFTNHYDWGDLKADPAEWMRRYFDAFVYWANWHTCRLSAVAAIAESRVPQDRVAALRQPRDTLDPVQQHALGAALDARRKRRRRPFCHGRWPRLDAATDSAAR
ncbi:hypothetical protein [Xanthomonas translucens]|uniref:hypothetical protein n=1 Tax=Xanthomonas campestris pv. translucens TaxID=343 RepID=UPI000AB039FC|nr:hypothetical protein [Xanthomonas translucens]UKE43495.1 hypothetical protein KAF26_19555 [Xanthomonas translucens pv. secalis]WLA01036.1 hypothetical protein MO330_20160 [Xanthomonas translucens]WLA12356.1 hypothetical protein MO327_19925 [Xanthomonas translucens]